MRPVVHAPLVLFAVAVIGGSAAAQSFPALAKVKVKAASVRGAAGEHTPETGKLEAGALVTVTAAEGNDWLAVQPPIGSISWVPWTLVEPQAAPGPEGKLPPRFNAVVTSDEGAAIRPGAVNESRPLGVQKTRLPKGTVVQVVGPRVKVKADGDELETNWYPIIAPKEDMRYVRRDAVEWAGAAPAASFVVKAGGTGSTPLPGTTPESGPGGKGTGDFVLSVPNGDRPQFPVTPGAAKPADWPNNYPLWREAEKARLGGDTKQARELYTRLAQEVSRDGTVQDLELANLCYDRIYNGLGGKPADGTAGTAGNSGWRPPADRPLKVEPPKAERGGKVVGGLLLDSRVDEKGQPSRTGKPFVLDGKWTVYLLADEKRLVRHYVISGGADLDRFVGKWVEVTGDEIRPDSLRGDPVVVASEVRAK